MKVNKAFKQSNPVWLLCVGVIALLVMWVSVMANQRGLMDFAARLSLPSGATSVARPTNSVRL